MWAKQKRNASSNYSCWTKKQFYVRGAGAHWRLYAGRLHHARYQLAYYTGLIKVSEQSAINVLFLPFNVDFNTCPLPHTHKQC